MNSLVSAHQKHPRPGKDRSSAATTVHRLLPAAGLWVLAPLTAEFLPGNVSIAHLGMLGIFAPPYGGGALLIRECVRRVGRGWPSIFALALAYGVLEEAFLMQSLFNPDFLGKHLHLLDPGHLSSMGIGAWWTVFVLTLHTVWSISVPIALVEAVVPERVDSPWLGGVSLMIVAVVFVLACISVAHFTVLNDPTHFVATRSQFTWAAAGIAFLIPLAFALPRSSAVRSSGPIPSPSVLGLEAFVVASIFLLVPRVWGGWAVLGYVGLFALAVSRIEQWSQRTGWRAVHRLALAGGAAMAYASHAFIEIPSIGDPGTITRLGNFIFAALVAGLIVLGAKKTVYQ